MLPKVPLKFFKNIALLMINALKFFSLLMILHYSLTILNINANTLSLIFFINANTLVVTNQPPMFGEVISEECMSLA